MRNEGTDDCTAYACANFHREFMRGKVTIVGCPKLDAVDYSEKLTEIIRKSVSRTAFKSSTNCRRSPTTFA